MALTILGCGGSTTTSVPTGPLVVDAGVDQWIPFDQFAVLQGSASHPEAELLWTQTGGPGPVVFERASFGGTRAAFPGSGRYELQLVARLGDREGADTMGVAVGAPLGPVVEVDRTTTFQTIRGWEATAYAAQDSPAFDLFKNEVFDRAVDDLGIDRVRLEVRSGAENDVDWWMQYQTGAIDQDTWRAHRYSTVNDNDDSAGIEPSGFQFSELDDHVDRVVEPLRQRAAARGEHLWVNLCYVAFTGQIGAGLEYLHDDADEYAEFVEATWRHLDSRYGWVPDSWEVILEPDNVTQWNGTTIGNAIVAVADRLRAAGWTPRFVAPSTTNMGNAVAYFDAMAAVPGAVDDLMELSYHRYGGATTANLQAIHDRAATWGLDTAHLEWIGASDDELFEDLRVGGVSSWAAYVLAGTGPDDGGAYYVVDTTDPMAPQVRLASRTGYLRHTFRYVRRGAVRWAATDAGAFSAVAFGNADGRAVVVVRAAAGGVFHVHGLPGGSYGVVHTTATETDVVGPNRFVIDGQALTASIPAAGVLTILER